MTFKARHGAMNLLLVVLLLAALEVAVFGAAASQTVAANESLNKILVGGDPGHKALETSSGTAIACGCGDPGGGSGGCC
jgi:hypothetical protein